MGADENSLESDHMQPRHADDGSTREMDIVPARSSLRGVLTRTT